ncbi:MAG TPA: hypothetical protein ENI23_15465 [bacterium]|nr:hypothetical protein [bacterium]
MPANPADTLQALSILTSIYLVVAFGITIYQIFLNRRQAKVHEQMTTLISETKLIREHLEKKK